MRLNNERLEKKQHHFICNEADWDQNNQTHMSNRKHYFTGEKILVAEVYSRLMVTKERRKF